MYSVTNLSPRTSHPRCQLPFPRSQTHCQQWQHKEGPANTRRTETALPVQPPTMPKWTSHNHKACTTRVIQTLDSAQTTCRSAFVHWELLGVLQRIIKAKSFGDHAAVFWNILFILSLTAYEPVVISFFWVLINAIRRQRRAEAFFRAVQDVSLPQPRMGQTDLCCWTLFRIFNK